jgi:hypothetical protein
MTSVSDIPYNHHYDLKECVDGNRTVARRLEEKQLDIAKMTRFVKRHLSTPAAAASAAKYFPGAGHHHYVALANDGDALRKHLSSDEFHGFDDDYLEEYALANDNMNPAELMLPVKPKSRRLDNHYYSAGLYEGAEAHKLYPTENDKFITVSTMYDPGAPTQLEYLGARNLSITLRRTSFNGDGQAFWNTARQYRVRVRAENPITDEDAVLGHQQFLTANWSGFSHTLNGEGFTLSRPQAAHTFGRPNFTYWLDYMQTYTNYAGKIMLRWNAPLSGLFEYAGGDRMEHLRYDLRVRRVTLQPPNGGAYYLSSSVR